MKKEIHGSLWSLRISIKYFALLYSFSVSVKRVCNSILHTCNLMCSRQRKKKTFANNNKITSKLNHKATATLRSNTFFPSFYSWIIRLFVYVLCAVTVNLFIWKIVLLVHLYDKYTLRMKNNKITCGLKRAFSPKSNLSFTLIAKNTARNKECRSKFIWKTIQKTKKILMKIKEKWNNYNRTYIVLLFRDNLCFCIDLNKWLLSRLIYAIIQIAYTSQNVNFTYFLVSISHKTCLIIETYLSDWIILNLYKFRLSLFPSIIILIMTLSNLNELSHTDKHQNVKKK